MIVQISIIDSQNLLGTQPTKVIGNLAIVFNDSRNVRDLFLEVL